MAELADAQDLKSCARYGRAGSNPASATMNIKELAGRTIVKVEDMKWQTLIHLDNGYIVRFPGPTELCTGEELPPLYDREFGDYKICKCGHHYKRHFDPFEEMEPVGCKYCHCDTFEQLELKPEVEEHIERLLIASRTPEDKEAVMDYIEEVTGFDKPAAFHLTLNRPNGRKWW